MLLVVPLLWLGWLGLRIWRGLRRHLVVAGLLLITGLITEVAAQMLDPFNFWDWIWD